MSWAIEEFAENAVVAYLNKQLTAGLLNLYTAWTDEEIKYPCVVVNAGKSSNVIDPFNGVRNVDIAVAVISEAVPVGAITARNCNRTLRDAVIEALAQTALHDDLNALVPDGVVFSLAYIGDITRSVEADKRVFVSEIQLVTVASPKALI